LPIEVTHNTSVRKMRREAPTLVRVQAGRRVGRIGHGIVYKCIDTVWQGTCGQAAAKRFKYTKKFAVVER
jgi:hypothetical protein